MSLYEIKDVKQEDPLLRFRWFTSDDAEVDLFVWQSAAHQIVHFQLCFDKSEDEKVVEWSIDQELRQARVDDGDTRHIYKSAPVFRRSEEDIDIEDALFVFEGVALDLDPEIRRFISDRLAGACHQR